MGASIVQYNLFLLPNRARYLTMVLRHNKTFSAQIAWLLALFIVLQNAMPLQAHTTMVTTASGETVIMCTLNGLKAISVDEDGLPSAHQIQQHNADSAAMQLSNLLAHASPALPAFSFTLIDLFISTPTIFNSVTLPPTKALIRAIRAPPTLSFR